MSKWYIALAAVGDGMGIYSVLPPVILLISALLTAGYLLPVAIDAFFPGHEEEGEHTGKSKAVEKQGKSLKTAAVTESALMYIPMLILSAAAVCVGIFGSQIADIMIKFF